MPTAAEAINTANSARSSESSSSSKSNLTVNTDAFLTLLVAQLSHQDPLSPQDDTQFVTQLAQMTTLEAMQQIGSSMSSIQAYSFVGKYAYAEVTNPESGETMCYHGIVDSIIKDNGNYYAIIGGNAVEADNIVQIFDAGLFDGDVTDMVGQIATGTYEGEDGKPATVTGFVTDILYEKSGVYAVVDGMKIPVDNIRKIDLSELIGQTVTGTYEEDGTPASLTGVVTGITHEKSGVYAVIDGIKISIDNITKIVAPPESEEPPEDGESQDGDQTTEA